MHAGAYRRRRARASTHRRATGPLSIASAPAVPCAAAMCCVGLSCQGLRLPNLHRSWTGIEGLAKCNGVIIKQAARHVAPAQTPTAGRECGCENATDTQRAPRTG